MEINQGHTAMHDQPIINIYSLTPLLFSFHVQATCLQVRLKYNALQPYRNGPKRENTETARYVSHCLLGVPSTSRFDIVEKHSTKQTKRQHGNEMSLGTSRGQHTRNTESHNTATHTHHTHTHTHSNSDAHMAAFHTAHFPDRNTRATQ